MKLLLIVLIAFLLTSCTTIRQYDDVKIWAGIQAPIPLYPINIGCQIELKTSEVVMADKIKRLALMEAYAEMCDMKQKGEKDETDNGVPTFNN